MLEKSFRGLFASVRSRVRIPPSPPARRKRHIACDEFFMLRIKNSSCAHFAAPRFRTGFAALDSGSDWETKISGIKPPDTSPRTSYRSRRLFILKSHRSFIPSLLLSKSNPLRWASIRVEKRKYPDWSHLTKRKTRQSRVFLFGFRAA